MRYSLLTCATGVFVGSALIAAGQARPPAPLSPELRAHLQEERFQVVTSVRGLPLGVRDGLQTLFGSQSLDIADPSAEFRADGIGAAGAVGAPPRRLVAAACSYEHCLVHYERGGQPRTWRVALFHWRPEATRFEWGGAAPGRWATVDDLRKGVLSGAVTPSAGPW